MISDAVRTSLSVDETDFNYTADGLGAAYGVFGDCLTPLLKELNEVPVL